MKRKQNEDDWGGRIVQKGHHGGIKWEQTIIIYVHEHAIMRSTTLLTKVKKNLEVLNKYNKRD